ncbi:MAG: glycosyltransferase [Alphaproteobacteria bacterium]
MFSYFDEKRLKRARRSVYMIVQNRVLNDSRVLKTAQSVRKLGYRVTLFGVHGRRHIETIEYSTFTIKRLPNARIALADQGAWADDINERDHASYDRVSAEQLLPFFRSDPPDVVHTHDMIGLAVGAVLHEEGALERSRWIHDIHEYVAGLNIAPPMQAHYEAVERKAITWPDALTTVSPTLADLIVEEQGLETPPRLVLNTPRCSDFDPHYPRTIRGALNLGPERPLIVYSGGVKAVRGVDMIVDMLPARPDCRLAIVTDSEGPDVDALDDKAQALGVGERVSKLPYVPFPNVTSFLSSASVGVHPIRRYPNAEIALPNKLFEYVHAGLPVVTSDNPTMKAFIEREGCGTTFPLDEPAKLAEGVDRALDMANTPDFRERLADIARRHCWEEQEKTLAEVYDALDPCPVGQASPVKKGESGEEKPLRVLQLPLPQAGQAAALADGLKAEGVAATSLSIRKNAFGYSSDVDIDLQYPDVKRDRNFFRQLAEDYDVFHFHVRSLLYRRSLTDGSGLDLIMFRLFGRKVFYHFRGSEIRLARAFHRHSPYAYANDDWDDIFADDADARRRGFRDFVQAACNGVFVPDPELQTSVPDAVIVPRALKLEDWPYIGAGQRERLKIVHAPSSRSTKGTDAVLAAIERLRREGHAFDFQLVEKMSHEQARTVYQDADIVIDQLRIGWYGVLAVEAMALGKAVVTYIRDDLRHYLPEPSPLDIANPDNLHLVLRGLLDDRDRVARLGRQARAFVEEVHDAQRIARFLRTIYAEFDGSFVDPTQIHAFLAMQMAGDKANGRWAAMRAVGRLRRWVQHVEPRRHLGVFVDTWRRQGADKAFKRSMAFLLHR